MTTVFAAAAAQAQSVAPAARDSRHVLADGVRTAQRDTNDATAHRRDLSGQVEGERRSRLAGDEVGRRLLADLDAAEFTAAATAVRGPGLSVTVTEPSGSRDLSDVSKQRVEGSPQVILDRDLQLVVNSLWVSGAEAISVGGVRIGPNVTIRQAGGGLLVDNQPIANPYVVIAMGPPHGMSDTFDRQPGLPASAGTRDLLRGDGHRQRSPTRDLCRRFDSRRPLRHGAGASMRGSTVKGER